MKHIETNVTVLNGDSEEIPMEMRVLHPIYPSNQHPQDHDRYSLRSIPDIELRIGTGGRSMFNSTLGSVLSCLGSAVGTGNIWRFPRILATYSYSRGSLTFYMAWSILLFLWSIPIVLVEYSIGRFTQNSPPSAFRKFLGKNFAWVGSWLVATVFIISCYYPVIIGWCLYYLWVSCSAANLPGDEASGINLFYSFARDTYWPVFFQILAVVLTGTFILGGIRIVEKANMILVPLLLLILGFTFGWSMTRPYADVGITFLFTPSWESLAKPSLWIAAAAQNAFDTGAGASVLLTYATYMGRSAGITRFSMLIPMVNNLVSLYASMTIFSTVFSTMIQDDGTMTRTAILRIMQQSGPGSTGLTFTWIPVLFSKVGIMGRVLCVLFFLCLSFAGISSLLANLQVPVLSIKELGVPHRYAVGITLLACILFGLPSAMKLEILENQDNTWGYALIISGFLLALVVICYQPFRFRRVIINQFGTNDWSAPILWIPIITILVPIQCIFLIGWWIYDYLSTVPEWYQLTYTSVPTILLEWLVVLVIIVSINMIAVKMKGDIYVNTRKLGSDPYDPSTYEPVEEIKLEGIRLANDGDSATVIKTANGIR